MARPEVRVVALPLLVGESRFCVVRLTAAIVVDTPRLSVVSTGVTAPSGYMERERGHNMDCIVTLFFPLAIM